ncbi:MAG: hypothetical protein F9K29_08175 [Hyphomicrobiaceae bacterium]|nr:MAG: hypothetical protein F9K29_08175 [Hyphomicrobiaceae bacterium]
MRHPIKGGAAAGDLISIRAAAKHLDVALHHSVLAKHVKSGQVRSHGGKVRLSEVIEDLAKNIDHSRAHRRRKPLPISSSGDATGVATPDETQPADGAARAIAANERKPDNEPDMLPYNQARAKKETWLARLRRLEFQLKSGSLVDAEAVKKAVFNCAREERDALMNWPARVTPLIAAEVGADPVALAVALEKHVREHLAGRATRFNIASG